MLFDQAINIPSSLVSDDVSVELLSERVRYSLRVKAKDVAAFKKLTGLKLPSKINSATSASGTKCAKLGPDEWLLVAEPKLAAKLDKALTQASNDFVCSVTDISHRNVGFDINGPLAAALLNVGCPLDLSLEKFPIGKATRTVFESATIILLRTAENSFHVVSWRSFAPYLRDYFARVITTR